uniref:small monomeric GTPase n=1 Tax=Anas platyrhynchos TaxID=8839 RepID=A0A8B9QT32_ANAPL
MGLRLRRSASFTPDHPALLEVPRPRRPESRSERARDGSRQRGEISPDCAFPHQALYRGVRRHGVRFLPILSCASLEPLPAPGTLEEFIYSHTLTVDGREILFHIWDVPNSQDQADDGSSEEKRIQWADSFVLVYSICDRASFDILPPKIQFIKAAKEGQSQEKVPIVIVGNKRDLHHQREVSSEEGRLLALSLDCGFYEVSAAEAYHGALMVFHGLA